MSDTEIPRFYPKGKRGTMRGPAKFNPMASSMKLFRAMRGLGADKPSITEVLAHHTAKQRRELKQKYMYVYKRQLAEALDMELGSSYGKLVHALMMEPEEYVLDCLQRTISPKSRTKKLVRRFSQLFSNGLGKDEYVLIDLLCFKSNEYLTAVKTSYKTKYGDDLDEKLTAEGNLLPQAVANIIQDMLACERDESEEVDEEHVNEDVDDILDPDITEVAIQAIFQERSYPHIRRIAVEFRRKSGKLFTEMLEESEKFSQEQKSTYVAIYNKIRNEAQYYAERLRTAIDGMGRDDDALIRIIVLRSELDLLDIMEAYKEKYEVELQENVASETSGDYREMLTNIIRVPDEKEKYVIEPEDMVMNQEELDKLSLDEDKLKRLMSEEDADADEEAEEDEAENGD